MRWVWHFKVKGQILVVFVVPACEDDENGGLLSIALIDTKKWEKIGKQSQREEFFEKMDNNLLMSFQVTNGTNVDATFGRICGE